MPMVSSRPNPLMMAVALFCYTMVFFAIAGGFLYIKGPPESGIIYNVVETVTGHQGSGIVYKAIGAVMVVAGIAVFGATVRRWSEYFFAVCFLMAVKALFALLVGYTISQPRLVVTRTQAAESLGLLVAMLLLSYRYSSHRPCTALESIGLVSAVVGLALGIALDPNIWPVVGGVLLLALSRLGRKQESRARA